MTIVLLLFLEEGLLCHLFGMGSAPEETCVVVSLVLLTINSTTLFAYLSRRYEEYDSEVTYALFFSLFLKVFLLLWDYYGTSVFILPNSHIDSEGFHRGAVYFAQYGLNRVENYSYVVGWIYRLFGIQRITAQYSNVILSFIGLDFLERTLQNFDVSYRIRGITLILASILPNYAIMSAILIRECIISVILCLALYFFSHWWKKGTLIFFILAELVSLAACWFHSGAIAATIGMAIALTITRREEDGSHYLNMGLASVILSALLFVGFLYLFDILSDSLLKRFHGLDMVTIDEYIEGHNFYSDTGETNSSYSAGIGGLSGIRGIIVNSPVRILYFLWSPLPWDFRGINDLIAFVGSSLFYGGTVIATLFWILRKKIEESKLSSMVVLLVLALCGAMVFAWGVDSAGSALRHREKFYFIYLLLFSILCEGRTRPETTISTNKR